MSEEKKYKLKKYMKLLIPILILCVIVGVKIGMMRWNGTPSTITVDSDKIQEYFKEALGQDKMLTISGKTDRVAYEWFYDVGTIQSIYDTNLKIYESGQWENKVEDCLQASSVFAFQFSDEIQLNGYPVLTLKLFHQNTEDVALYQLKDGILTFLSNPIVNLMEDGAEITYPVYDTEGILCLVSDSQNKVAVAELFSTQNQQEFVAQANVESGSEDIQNPEESNQFNEVDNSLTMEQQVANEKDGKQQAIIQEETMAANQEGLNQNGSTSSGISSNTGNSGQAVHNSSEDLTTDSNATQMEQVLQSSDQSSLARVEITDAPKEPSGKNEDTTSVVKDSAQSNGNDKKQSEGVVVEDKKPEGQVSSIHANTTSSSDSTRVVSDGKQTMKDQYETDPVPAGKPLPVEPEHQTINYKQAYSCTLSIDCLTILNNMSDLDGTKKSYVPEDGYIFKSKKVIFYEGESVFDVLLRETQKAGIPMEYSMTPIYNSNYIEGINNLYEFDCGNLSGWMYSVDGWYPNYGCSRYVLKDGEVITWRYTCDLGRDVGCEWLDETK